jgi:hypothetical protein
MLASDMSRDEAVVATISLICRDSNPDAWTNMLFTPPVFRPASCSKLELLRRVIGSSV